MPNRIFRNEHGLPFIEISVGETRMLGCLKPDPNFSAIPDFASAYQLLPQSQWTENSLKPANAPLRDQGQQGSCVGQGSTTAFQYAKTLAGHTEHVYSASFVYGQINGGKDGGAQVSQGMMELLQTGVCTEKTVPEGEIFKTQYPQEAYTEAARFKALQAYKVNSFEELCTALTLGFPCASGIAVGRNFVRGQLDNNGLAPLPDVIVGGHCMCHMGLRNLNGMWVVETQNSWKGWGMGQFCYLQQGHWNPGYGFPFDCFAIYSVIEDPQDTTTEPPAIITG